MMRRHRRRSKYHGLDDEDEMANILASEPHNRMSSTMPLDDDNLDHLGRGDRLAKARHERYDSADLTSFEPDLLEPEAADGSCTSFNKKTDEFPGEGHYVGGPKNVEESSSSQPNVDR
eukprot:1009298_1